MRCVIAILVLVLAQVATARLVLGSTNVTLLGLASNEVYLKAQSAVLKVAGSAVEVAPGTSFVTEDVVLDGTSLAATLQTMTSALTAATTGLAAANTRLNTLNATSMTTVSRVTNLEGWATSVSNSFPNIGRTGPTLQAINTFTSINTNYSGSSFTSYQNITAPITITATRASTVVCHATGSFYRNSATLCQYYLAIGQGPECPHGPSGCSIVTNFYAASYITPPVSHPGYLPFALHRTFPVSAGQSIYVSVRGNANACYTSAGVYATRLQCYLFETPQAFTPII